MTTVLLLLSMAMLGAAAVLVLVQMYKGPTNLDRIVAADILLVIVIGGIALDAAWHRRSSSLPLLMIIGLIAWVGGVAVTRFLAHDTDAPTDLPPPTIAQIPIWKAAHTKGRLNQPPPADAVQPFESPRPDDQDGATP